MSASDERSDDPTSSEAIRELFLSLQSKLPPPFVKAVEDVRGAVLSLIFYKIVSDTYRDQLRKWTEELGDEDLARNLDLYRFAVPQGHGWEELRMREHDLDLFLNESLLAIEHANHQRLEGISRADYVREEALTDKALSRLIAHLSQHNLSLERIRPNVLGKAFVTFARFLPGRGRKDQHRDTPEEIARLMVGLVSPFKAGDRIHDPVCGVGGLLTEVARNHREEQGEDPAQLFLAGQEIDPGLAALAKMAFAIYDFHGRIELGDSLTDPQFTRNGGLSQFDCVLADFPPTRQTRLSEVGGSSYGRFGWSDNLPEKGGSTWALVMHIASQLREEGKAVIAAPRPALQEGGDVLRRELVSRNLLRAVVGLDSNVFEEAPTGKLLLLLGGGIEAPEEGVLFYRTTTEDYAQVERDRWRLKNKPVERVAEVVKNQVVEGNAGRVVPHNEIRRHAYALTPETYHRD